MSSRLIHSVADVRISFLLRLKNTPLYEGTTVYLFSGWGQGLFYLLANVKNAMNTGVQYLFEF